MTARLRILSALSLVTLACGGPVGSEVNGFWLPGDGGRGVIVFGPPGEELWWGRTLFFARISSAFEGDCVDYQRSASGLLTSPKATAKYQAYRSVVSRVDAGWNLQFEFPPKPSIDLQYRVSPGNDAGSIVGTVTAQFTGSMSLDSPDLARVSYRLEYRDSVKLLSTEEASFVAPRAEQCK